MHPCSIRAMKGRNGRLPGLAASLAPGLLVLRAKVDCDRVGHLVSLSSLHVGYVKAQVHMCMHTCTRMRTHTQNTTKKQRNKLRLVIDI